MPRNEDMYLNLGVEDGSDSQRFSGVRIFKVGAVLIGGACLVLVTMMGVSVLIPSLQGTSGAESTNLVGMPTSLRSSSMKGIGQGFSASAYLASLPGGKWKELALASIESANQCSTSRDVSMKANPRLTAAVENMDKKDLRVMAAMARRTKKAAGQMVRGAPYGLEAGIVGPTKGLWDPFKLSAQTTEGELLFFREAEIKHGRVCMLASLGFWVGDNVHPLFGDPDVPAIQAPVSSVEILLFWPIIFAVIGVLEVPFLDRIDYSVPDSAGFTPELKPGVVPGDIGFDPLGIKPDDPELYLKRQNQEILHGRLAMIATAGMIAQETFTQARLNEGGIFGER